jgi:hypothetical protein
LTRKLLAIDCFNHAIFIQFIAIIQAVLSAGKRLQQLNIGEGDSDNSNNKLRSELLKKLISTASSASVIGNSAKMLSSLNKDSAYQGDLTNMFIATEGQFPEVCVCICVKKIILYNLLLFGLHFVLSALVLIYVKNMTMNR